MAIITSCLYFGLKDVRLNNWFYIYVNVGWLIISYQLGFYQLRRYNKNADVISRFLLQFVIFTFVYFTYFSLSKTVIDLKTHFKILLSIFVGIAIFRMVYLWALKKYRIEGGNFRNIALAGSNESIQKITKFFENHPELGYRIVGYFCNKRSDMPHYLGDIETSFEYMSNNQVDELYGSISDLTKSQIDAYIRFTDNNFITLKLLPDAKNVYSTKMEVEYLDYLPVLSLRKIPFDVSINKYLKRFFDILFSLFIIIFVLSWLTPLLFILIKIDSRGPLFFKQIRDGIKGDQFVCYKFRSMYENTQSDDIQATKLDDRVTAMGKFMRRTSIDELPQFFNVFLGDMSVVGPRPHMLSQTKKYAKVVDKFMVRHFVKPGITGLAQVRGYRGEVEKNSDMENRIRLDIYYIENWSFLLDIKIIIQTIINLLKGDDKAY